MRYLIDTNILLFLLMDIDSIEQSMLNILMDYENQIYTSAVCMQELIHLYQTGKVKFKKKQDINTILKDINNIGITIALVEKEHLYTYAHLPIIADHNDPNDRVIIAQAISAKIPLMSSDTKFKHYKKYKLDFVFNKRIFKIEFTFWVNSIFLYRYLDMKYVLYLFIGIVN